MFATKVGSGLCALFVIGLLTGCGSSGSDSSSDDTSGALVHGGDEASGDEPTDLAPRALNVNCTMKDSKYAATAKGEIKIGSDKKLLPGTTITMDFESGPSADLTVKSGSVEDMESQTGTIVLVWKKLGAEIVEATMKYDGAQKHGTTTSSLGDFDFDAQCTFTR
jgi:hypothetical protein